MTQIIIQGRHITDIASFYTEINRVFMEGEDWQLGQTLDGFNDLLYGGFGRLHSVEKAELLWVDIGFSKAALGYDCTREYYLAKLKPDSPFDKNRFSVALEALEAGHGKTYFNIIMEIIAEHDNIHLIEG